MTDETSLCCLNHPTAQLTLSALTRAYVEYQAFSSLIWNSFQVQVSNKIFHVQAFQAFWVLVCTTTYPLKKCRFRRQVESLYRINSNFHKEMNTWILSVILTYLPKYMLSYVLNFAGSKIQYFFILEKLETRLNIPGQYSKKLEHDFDVQT